MPKETAPTASEAFDRIRRQRIATHDYITQRRAQCAAGCSADLVLSIAQHCGDVLRILDAAAATPGLVAFARAQYGDAAYDMVQEYQALRAALVSLRDSIVTLFPQDENGWLLYQKLSADGSITTRQLQSTAPQLAGLLTRLDAVLDAIP